MLVVGDYGFQALVNLMRHVTVQFSDTYIMGTTGARIVGYLVLPSYQYSLQEYKACTVYYC